MPDRIDFNDARKQPLSRLGQQILRRHCARRHFVETRRESRCFGLMLLARAGRFGCQPTAFGFRSRQRRFQIFDPGPRVTERRVPLGGRSRQPRILFGQGIELSLKPIARRAQLVLQTFGALADWLPFGRREAGLQGFDSGAGIVESAVSRSELLRQQRVFRRQATGLLLNALARRAKVLLQVLLQVLGALVGRFRGRSHRLCGSLRGACHRDHRRRPPFQTSDFGARFIELARKPDLDGPGERISTGFRDEPRKLPPFEQGAALIGGSFGRGCQCGVRSNEAGGLTMPPVPPDPFSECHVRLFKQ
ncbi:MAG: hypothetical protein ACLPXW_01990 [Xanthobacteraceae bacterium]